LDVNLSSKQIESIFADAQDDQVSAKHYTLYSNGNVEVQVRVYEYEPESAHIEVQSKNVSQKRLERIHADAEYDMIRQWRSIDTEIPSQR
tara:strand:- start:8020 stop:8289 length:270 start_codon:yes stop_codon:yes gene_type:complete